MYPASDRRHQGQRHRTRRHADVDRGPAGRVPLHRHHPCRPRRRDHPHRHRRRLPRGRGRGRTQRVPDRAGARVVRRGHLRGAGRHQGRPPPPRRRPLDCSTALRSTCGRRATRRCVASASRRSGSTSSTDRTRRCRTRTRSGRSATCSTPARSGWPGSPTPTPSRSSVAQEILGGRLVSVQNQFSPAFRSSEPELRLCDQLGIAFLPWSPLGGIKNASDLGASFRPFAEVAQEVDATPQQVTLAWMLAKSPVVIPIPGSSRPETVRASAARRRPPAHRRAGGPVGPAVTTLQEPPRPAAGSPAGAAAGAPGRPDGGDRPGRRVQLPEPGSCVRGQHDRQRGVPGSGPVRRRRHLDRGKPARGGRLRPRRSGGRAVARRS